MISTNLARLKTTRPGVAQPLLSLPYLLRETRLCVARTFDEYIELASILRQNEEGLFIDVRKPFKKVSSQILSHWLNNALEDTGTFKEYSSKSKRNRRSFYNRPIVTV